MHRSTLTARDLKDIMSHYDVGACTRSEILTHGSVQTNVIIHTGKDRYVLRYYENRTKEAVNFESDLIEFLEQNNFPCPYQIRGKNGGYVNTLRDKPYILFNYIEGKHLKQPNSHQWNQLIQVTAELQKVTQNFNSKYTPHRWNYDSELCRTRANEAVKRVGTKNGNAKYHWLEIELATLSLHSSLPKGICHCDLNFTNVFFQGDRLVALLDFDDANVTFLQFDLVGLIEYRAWPLSTELLDFAAAKTVVEEYSKHRPLPEVEKLHLFDVYKLSILFDCVWYFDRGDSGNFRERRKIEALNRLGRNRFIDALF